MSKHIYIDESVRINYIVPLVIVETEKIKEIRKSLRQFVKNNHKNIHMFKANKAFKNRILKEVMSYDLEIVIIEDLNFRFRKSLSRQICLRSGFEYISKFDINRIVLDRSNSQEKDLITYQKSSRKFPTLPENLHHIASRQEPLLWLPDIFAWSYGAGGIWRERIDEKISFIKRV
jgi:hypothetical protein